MTCKTVVGKGVGWISELGWFGAFLLLKSPGLYESLGLLYLESSSHVDIVDCI